MADKKFTRKEIEQKKGKDIIFIIDNLVYDVTAFMDEHPGGHEVLVNVSGRDGSEDFDDVGHSLDAKELMKKYVIGELVEEDKVHKAKRVISWDESKESSSFTSSWQFPVVLGVVLTILYTYFFG